MIDTKIDTGVVDRLADDLISELAWSGEEYINLMYALGEALVRLAKGNCADVNLLEQVLDFAEAGGLDSE